MTTMKWSPGRRKIKDIINKIIDKNDMTEMKKFADYRNYMSYEIIINMMR